MMKRFLALLLLTPLGGCVAFEQYPYEEPEAPWSTPSGCGCQAASHEPPRATTLSQTAGPMPILSQMSGGQTREPELSSK